MDRYKSWSGLNRQLQGLLCRPLRGRISYFLTRYHTVHNAYGRAAVRLDQKELVTFSWTEMYRQDRDAGELAVPVAWREEGDRESGEILYLKDKWNRNGTWCEMDFLDAALAFRNLPVRQALESEQYLIRMLAILDRRAGKRTLMQIGRQGSYRTYPQWLRQFYELRLEAEGLHVTAMPAGPAPDDRVRDTVRKK